ncbi:MAG: MBL fold metallo-hydrolase [Treponema sp.]|nr:MBL fold metallo-hydrolase [Treponema sp.]
MGYYRVRQIYPWLHSIFDPLEEAFCYLAVGDERAVLVDSGNGIGNLTETVAGITEKPVELILAHGHSDHAGGAFQFGEAWLHEADFGLCGKHTSAKARGRDLDYNPETQSLLPEGFDREAYLNAGTGTLKPLEPGRVFDLGGLHLEVIPMGGHTAGSVGLLAREHRILLDSDSANAHVWLFLRESLSIKEYLAMLERVAELDFDFYFSGHYDKPRPVSDFARFIRVARNATPEKAVPFPVFPEFGGMLYREGGAELIFSKDKL